MNTKQKKLLEILLVYIVIIIILGFGGKTFYKENPQQGMIYGIVAGIIVSIVLWFAAGKKMYQKA